MTSDKGINSISFLLKKERHGVFFQSFKAFFCYSNFSDHAQNSLFFKMVYGDPIQSIRNVDS